MFVKWLSVITQKEITNKTIIKDACKSEEIFMAVSTLAQHGEDKYLREAYLRRQDEIYFHNKTMYELSEYKRQAEQEKFRAEQEKFRAEQAEAEIEKLRQQIAALQAN